MNTSWLHGMSRTGYGQRTTTTPAYGRGRVTVCSAREVGERSVRGYLVGEWGDSLALD